MQLRRLRLALQRLQPRARLPLDVERTVEVVARAFELQLGAPAALAVLAEPRGLLDQEPPVAGLRRDDGLHAALGDDRVHLLAEPRVGEDLDHVEQTAARAVEPVLTLPRAVETPRDRDLAHRQAERAVRVVEDELDLGRRAGLRATAAGEDHVLHRLAANGEGRLLAQHPQHRVGHVRLPRPVRPDDDAHAGPELEGRPVRERLEALHVDRLEVHQVKCSAGLPAPRPDGAGLPPVARDRAASPASSISRSATRAASCSPCFLLRPLPSPTTRSPTVA